jgi:hypothetical protein
VAFTFGVSFFVNAWDYTFGVHKEKTIFSREFSVSTLVDTVLGVAVSLLAAGTVALIVAGLVYFGIITAVLSTPALIIIGAATVLLATAIGLGIEYGLGWPDMIKDTINSRLNEL